MFKFLSQATAAVAVAVAIFLASGCSSSPQGNSPTFQAQASLPQPVEFDVKRYGAVGNGTTNDTAAIQAAIDAAEVFTGSNTSQRARVIFPRGAYGVTTLTIDGPRIDIDAYDARLEQLSGTGFNQMVYIKGEADGGLADDIVIRGLTIDGNYPAVDNSGSGIGFNIRANDVTLIDVTARATEDSTFIAAYCMRTKFLRCKSYDAGRCAFRPRGDDQEIHDCEAYNWNVVNDNNGNRAILFDSQQIDAESFVVDGFYAESTTQHVGMEVFLVDCGDGGVTTTNSAPTRNSGNASSSTGAVDGKAQWTIDAGHGFLPGDGIKIEGTGLTKYDGTAGGGKVHKILSTTGNTFIRKVDANTFQLYTTADAAIADGEDGLGGATNRYDISDDGSGTFYVKAPGALRKTFIVASATNDTLTCMNHGFTTGTMARLTLDDPDTEAFPTGLNGAAIITTNTDYAGTGTTCEYWRPKRLKNLVWRNVRVLAISPDGEDGAVLKTNNVCNVLLDRFFVECAPDYGPNGFLTYKIGPGCRKVTVRNCRLPNGLDFNTNAWCQEAVIEDNEIGDGSVYPTVAIDSIQAARLTIRKNKLRFSAYGLTTPAITLSSDLVQDDIEQWDVTDNDFEGYDTDRSTCLRIYDAANQLHATGLVRWYGNTRHNTLYSGLPVTTASSDTCTATNHALFTGDIVYFTTAGTLDSAITQYQPYVVRRTGDNTFTIHTTAWGASNNTDRVDISTASGGAGSGAHTLRDFSGKLGCNLTNSNPTDRMLLQRDATGKNFFGVSAPSSTSVVFNAGDIVWNMNPSTGSDTDGDQPMGWLCTKSGQLDTSAGTFRTFYAYTTDPTP